MSDGTKSMFESWTVSEENAAQMSKQDILCIAFSKMIGPPLTLAHRLRDHVPFILLSKLLSKIHHTTYMAQIPTEG